MLVEIFQGSSLGAVAKITGERTDSIEPEGVRMDGVGKKQGPGKLSHFELGFVEGFLTIVNYFRCIVKNARSPFGVLPR